MAKLQLLVVSTVTLIALMGPQRAIATSSSFPKYVNAKGGWIVASGTAWKSAHTVYPVKQALGSLVNPGTIKARYVWTRGCPSGPQTAVFSRVITVPGAPSAADFAWSGPFTPNTLNPWLTSIKLVVNGVTVLRIHPSVQSLTMDLTAAEMARFVLGTNTIEVEATKSRNPSSITCKQAKPYLGIAFALEGLSAAHLTVTPPSNGSQRYVKTRTLGLSGAIVVRNDGPSAALGAQLVFDGQFDAAEDGLISVTPSAGSCTETTPRVHVTEETCTLGTLAPGATVSIAVKSFIQGDTTNRGTIITTYDAPRASSCDVTFYMCGPASPESLCATAPSGGSGSP